MGSPASPTEAQVNRMNQATAAGVVPRAAEIADGRLVLTLEPDALVLVTIGRK